MRSPRRVDAAALGTILLVGCIYVTAVLWKQARVGDVQIPVHPPYGLSYPEDLARLLPSYDLYAQHYPTMIYALEALRRGHGLLWNSLQNCGQPFLPSTGAALLYPVNLLFLVLPTNAVFFVIAALHMAIAGAGAYLLCRQYGLSRLASLCGGIGFEISGQVIGLTADLPTSFLGVYIWLPMALFCGELILESPTPLRGIALGVTLTLQLLAGHPQPLFFTYQLLVLRVIWEMATTHLTQPARTLCVLAGGLVLPVFLGAAQLVPMAEFARESFRNAVLRGSEISPFGVWSWADFRSGRGGWRTGFVAIFGMIPAALAALAFVRPGKRRLPLFFVLIATLYLALAVDSPLFALYRELPLGSLFREPVRFLWVTGFALSVLGAFGAETLCVAADGFPERRVPLVLAPLIASVALYLLVPSSVDRFEWVLLGALLTVCILVTSVRPRFPLAGVAAAVLVTADLFLVNSRPWYGFFKDASLLYKHQDAFAFLKAHMTPQDRVHQYGKIPGFSMMPKSASIFGVPSISDYEPQTSRRYAELYVRVMDDVKMDNIMQHVFRFNNVPRNTGLFNLIAVRYVMVEKTQAQPAAVLADGPPKLIWDNPSVAIYENSAALPRAFYVPAAEVVPDASQLLDRMASSGHDPREAALLEGPPPDGFVGASPTNRGEVSFLRDRSEEIALKVLATGPGFLFISDQYYPGWEATVNGLPMPVLRANYVFRLIRVPGGESLVILHYRPTSIWLGALISLATLAALGVYGASRSVRRSDAGRLRTSSLGHE